jgi:hypothetical protein
MKRKKYLAWSGAVLAVLFPLALLLNFHAEFYADWKNNLWLAAYQGAFLRYHGIFAAVLNYQYAVGGPAPLFYGYLFYPLVGIVASVGGAHLALRAALFAVGGAELWGLYAAGRNVFRHRGLALVVALSILWSSYGLTNLYNRSAVPEYFAVSCLAASAGFILASLTAEPAQPQRLWIWMGCLCGTLAMGSHPITALLGAPFIGGLIVFGIWGHWRGATARYGPGAWAVLIAGASLGFLALLPWGMLAQHWASRLEIVGPPQGVMHFFERCDTLAGRFLPWPHDALPAAMESQASTPYLEAPLAMSLAPLLVWLVIGGMRHRNGDAEDRRLRPEAWVMLILSLLWIALLSAISLSAKVGDLFPQLGVVQFSYRLVSHCNLALALACLAAGLLSRPWIAFRSKDAALLTGLCCGIAAGGVMLKLVHGRAVEGSTTSSAYGLAPNPSRLIDGRDNSVGLEPSYATTSILPALAESEAANIFYLPFPVAGRGSHFGEVGEIHARFDTPRWVLTNAEVFPYCELLENGRLIPVERLAHVDWAVAVHLPAGSETLTWRWNPPAGWRRLHAVGMIAFIGMLLATPLLAAWEWRRHR